MAQQDDSDESRTATYRKYDIHEGILFLIELSDGMFQKLPELSGGVQIIEILNTLLTLMSQLVITRPGTGIGCYFYNCFKEEADENGIYQYFPLVDVNAKNMKKLSDFLEDLTYGRVTLSQVLPFEGTKRSSLEAVFELIKTQFIKDTPGQKKFNNKKVFFFTDNDRPPEESDPEAKSRLSHLVNDLDDYYIGFTTFFIGSRERPFDSSFYSEILRLDASTNTEFDGPNTQPISATYIKSRILRKQEIKRILFQCPLILEERSNFVIGIKGYSIISREKAGVRYKLVYEKEDVRIEAFSRRKFLDCKTGEDVKEGLAKVLPYGDMNISLSDEEFSAMTGDYNGEISQLKVIGFRSTNKCVHYYNNIDKPSFVVPDETTYEGSIKTLASLFKCLRKKSKSAVVWGKIKANSNPSLFVLSPSDELSPNEGFYMYRIPFLDEIRKFPYVSPCTDDLRHVQEYKELRELTKKIIGYFNLKDGYEASEFKNPSLLRHFKILHDYLLQIEDDEGESAPEKQKEKLLLADDSLRKIAQVREKIMESGNSEDPQQRNLSKLLAEWNQIYHQITESATGDFVKSKKARR